MITNVHMSCQLGAIRENGVIADLAVVCQMHIRHDPVVIAQPGDPGVLYRATVKGAEFAYGIPIADFEPSRLSCIFLVLRRLAQRYELKNPVVTADAGTAGNHRVRA